MKLEDMAGVLKSSLGLSGESVGVVLFRTANDIPQGLPEIEKPTAYCTMVQRARKGETIFAPPAKHDCKGGAAGMGLMECPENIASGNLYFTKLNKVCSPGVGQRIVNDMPRMNPGSVMATLVGPLGSLPMNPDVVIVVGSPLAARRIVQAVMYKHGGRMEFNTAGIQSFCVDATSSPYLKGDVNVSLGCDGSAKKSKLQDDEVVVGIPFEMVEDICTVLAEKGSGWENWMRT